MGMVEDIERGRDTIIRMVNIKYYNGLSKTPQFTLRSVRKIVKLWDVDDMHLDEDLAELQRKFGPIPGLSGGEQVDRNDMTVDQGGVDAGPFNEILIQEAVQVNDDDCQPGVEQEQHGAELLGQLADLRVQPVHRPACKACCCEAHHLYSLHYSGSKFVTLPCDSMEWVYPSLAKELGRDTFKETSGATEEGLEDIMMSVNVNLDSLM